MFGALIVVLTIALFMACSQSGDDRVVEVVAEDFAFFFTDTIPSGWNTFKFKNGGHTEHFFLLNKLPDSISYATYVESVPIVFQEVHDALADGVSREDAVAMLVDKAPAWYFTDVRQMGGSGIISMGDSQTVTLNLPPGTYALECYIKEQGIFHTTLGMIDSLVVTDAVSGTQPPRPNMTINLSNSELSLSGEIYKGRNIFAVNYQEHPEIGLGNDIHIAAMSPSTSLDSVLAWLDWMNLTGLQTPAPTKFFGGAQEMPVGQTAYFTTVLPAGDYVIVSESIHGPELATRITVD